MKFLFVRCFFIAAISLVASPAASFGATHAKYPAGGAYQKPSVEGCMNQWLFNGAWRMRVSSVEPITDGSWPGFGVNVEVRNATHKTIELGNAGVQGRGQGVQLITDDGNALILNDLDYQQLGYRDIVQGGSATHQLKFHFPTGASSSPKPAKFILQIDPHDSTSAHYTMSDPSFRVDLTCTK